MTVNESARSSCHYSLPLDDRTGPSQSASEHDHQHVVTFFDSARTIRFIKRDGDRCRRSVAVAIDIDENLLSGNPEPLSDSFDDAQIRLMRNNAGDVIDGETGLFDRFPRGPEHGRDGLLVNFLP